MPDWLKEELGFSLEAEAKPMMPRAAETMRQNAAAGPGNQRFDGRVRVEIKAPRGVAKVAAVSASGAAGMNLYAGEVDCW